MRSLLPLVLLAGVVVALGTALLARRNAAWVRPPGPTADRVIARIHASGEISATHGPTTEKQTSILTGPVRLRGTLGPHNAQGLQRLLEGLRAFAKPRQGPGIWNDLPHVLEIEVEEGALTAWLSWMLYMAQQDDVGLTNVVLRRMPSGRRVALALPKLNETAGPRTFDKEEPRTRIKLRRRRLPPKDDRLILKVSRFDHYVGDEYEILPEGEVGPGPPPPRYVADLPSIAAWRTTAGRRLLAKRLRHVRALLRDDLTHLDEVPLDVIVEPIYTRFADFPAYIVLDVLEGLRGLANTRLQCEATGEGWR